MSYQNILIEHIEHTAIIRINRESKLNALNEETIGELKAAVEQLRDDPQTFGLILTGAGQKAFVAGADIQEFIGKSKEEGSALSRFGHELMDNLTHFPKPVLAAINGFALGGGLELAMACHIRYASDNAKMGLPEVSLGLIPGYGGTFRLTQLVGKGKALEMILTGDMIDAQEALKCGLVNKVFAPEELLNEAQKMLQKTYTRSKTALKAAIVAVNASAQEDALEREIESFGTCFGEKDFLEGVSAFLEKRKPNF